MIMIASGILAYILSYGISNLLPELFLNSTNLRLTAVFLCAFPVIALVIWAALKYMPPPRIGFGLACAVVLIAIPQWWSKERSASYELRDTAHWMAQSHPTAVLGGTWGPELALWTELDAYMTWTKTAMQKVTLVVEEAEPLARVPPPVRPGRIEFRELRTIHRTIAFMEVQR